MAILWDQISSDQFSAADRRAKAFGLEDVSIKLEKQPYNLPAAFKKMTQDGAQLVLVLSSPFMGQNAQGIVELTIRHRLPAMFIFRAYAELGGLMSYGADPVAIYRQVAVYVSKILHGANPADLPVEQPNKFELVVNLKTAKSTRIELPPEILLRADKVIE